MDKLMKIGIICMVIGAVMFAGVGVFAGFDFRAAAESVPEEKTVEISEAFTEIDIENDSGTIRVEKSQDGGCRVVCKQNDNYIYRVSVKEGELKIKGERKGLVRFIDFDSRDLSVTLYLPEGAYDEIDAESASGDIYIDAGLTFREAEMQAASGSLTFDGVASRELEARTASGDIAINGSADRATLNAASGDITVNGEVNALNAETASGSVKIASARMGAVRVSTASGDIIFDGMNAESIDAHSTSGAVEFIRADARKINVKTTSGDVTGTLLTDKIFNVETTSGDADTARSVSGGGECDIKTTSGDVHLDVE